MKNLYYLVSTDRARECAEVIETFTNKKKALAECKSLNNHRDAVNGLRRSEGSRERITDYYYVTNTDAFEGEDRRVTREMIVM